MPSILFAAFEALAALSALREKPAGTIRVTATEYAADAILMPALSKILPKYPEIKVEVVIDYGLTNIVAQQVDAGIRPGELVAKDMIAVRVSPDLRMAVVGSPSYFAERKRPKIPQDLTHHNCLNLRLPTHGGSLYALSLRIEFAAHASDMDSPPEVDFLDVTVEAADAIEDAGHRELPDRELSDLTEAVNAAIESDYKLRAAIEAVCLDAAVDRDPD